VNEKKTPTSLGYPPSVFNKNSTLKPPCPWDTHYQFSIKILLSKKKVSCVSKCVSVRFSFFPTPLSRPRTLGIWGTEFAAAADICELGVFRSDSFLLLLLRFINTLKLEGKNKCRSTRQRVLDVYFAYISIIVTEVLTDDLRCVPHCNRPWVVLQVQTKGRTRHLHC